MVSHQASVPMNTAEGSNVRLFFLQTVKAVIHVGVETTVKACPGMSALRHKIQRLRHRMQACWDLSSGKLSTKTGHECNAPDCATQIDYK